MNIPYPYLTNEIWRKISVAHIGSNNSWKHLNRPLKINPRINNRITKTQAINILELLCDTNYTHKKISSIAQCSVNVVFDISKSKTWKYLNPNNKYNLKTYHK